MSSDSASRCPQRRVPERFSHETDLFATEVTGPVAACGFIEVAEHVGQPGASVRFMPRGATRVRAPRFRGSMSVTRIQSVAINDIDDRNRDGVEFAAGLFDLAGPC